MIQLFNKLSVALMTEVHDDSKKGGAFDRTQSLKACGFQRLPGTWKGSGWKRPFPV